MNQDKGQRFLRGSGRLTRRGPRTRGRRARWLLLAAVAGAGLGVGWGAASFGYGAVMGWSVLAVRSVVVEGAERADAAAIEGRLLGLVGRNILTLDLKEIRGIVSQDPWVRDATVQRIFPDSVVVTLVERRPTAVSADSGRLIDAEGAFVEGSRAGLAETGFPRVAGADRAAPQALGRAMELIETLSRSTASLLERVRVIDVTDPDDLKLVLADSNRTVHLGTDAFAPRLNRFLNVESVITERFPLATSVDLRFAGRVIVTPVSGE